MIDGPTLVRDALAAGVVIEEVFATREAEASLVAAAVSGGASSWTVTPESLARAVDTVTPQGVAAIARRIEVGIDEAFAAAARGPLTLVLADVADPGNAGTLLRAAEASGAAAVLFSGTSVDPANAKCVRASAGALFHLPVAVGGDVPGVLRGLARHGVRTVGAAVDGGVPYDRADLSSPVAVVLGSEAHGLAPEVLALVDERVSIPMVGRAESLNVAMAGTLLCFEALRQRRCEPIGEVRT